MCVGVELSRLRSRCLLVLITCGQRQWADDVMRISEELKFAGLAWLYGLFVGTLMSRTDVYAGCSRTTLNFIERFELGSLRMYTICHRQPKLDDVTRL